MVGLLFSLLAEVTNENAKGEYYLTDVVELARRRGAPTRAVMAGEDAVMGVNAQGELAQAEALFQKVQRESFLAAGVTMSAPDTVHFAWDTQVGGGTVIEPFVVFGSGAVIEGGARIRSFSHVEGARVAAGAGVLADVPAGETWSGYPARPIRQFLRETVWLAKQASSKKAPKES